MALLDKMLLLIMLGNIDMLNNNNNNINSANMINFFNTFAFKIFHC